MSSQYTKGSRASGLKSILSEDDEWAEIQKFNEMLHFEEQRQNALRDRDRKRLIKEELDRQLAEKGNRKKAEEEEKRKYEEMQKNHINYLNDREQDHKDEMRRKTNLEKENREIQIAFEKKKKADEAQKQRIEEEEMVMRLKAEMEVERQNF